ncbi:2OG-Fe(II) oxygenase [Iningainema tapete]|uniref:2OG-Fe(II) oxygenase n=1 Tax=Iningainema tapete BLCC-T55 TaxID=2748662 RepID=A0A8J7C6C1_9CYAN|nr:2OG-Fe(II) oxygenase [Iningainema tapete]MBD2774134.1 2OG-Fe(II) oxygenase [Iningainema tapete BLCC-T55]
MVTIFTKARNRILSNLYNLSFLQNSAEIAYQTAVKKHLSNLPIISATDKVLVEIIRREGIAITSLEALSIPSTEQMFQAAKSLMVKLPRSITGDRNEFIVHATPEQMMEYPEIFIWGLEQRLLNIVENYLSLPVAYHGAYFRRDIANEVKQKSRLWHIDKEDRKLLKIIIYLNDVNKDGGPFQYLPQSLTSKVARALKYNYTYIDDRQMSKVTSPSDWLSCTGSAGTVIFAGTGSIFHRGKIPVTKDRYTIFFDYTSRQPKHPFYCKSSLPEQDLLLLTTKIAEHQKQYIFWR